MAKNDQQEAYEKLLSATLSRTIDFVKFAEAKNAALLTFSSAWILASVNLAFSEHPVSVEWQFPLKIAIPLFVVSAIISITSFLPKTNLAKLNRDAAQDKSLLYFGDICDFAPASYRERLSQRYMPPDGHSATQNYIDDLTVQISVNSSIAMRKFRFFNFGARVAMVAVALLLIPPGKSAVLAALAYAAH